MTGAAGPSRREQQIAGAFVDLADGSVGDLPASDLLGRLVGHCVELLDVAAAGVLLAEPDGTVRLVASSCDRLRALALFELSCGAGPGLAAYRGGLVVEQPDLTVADPRWMELTYRARAAGFGRAHALPLRLRTHALGALDLLGHRAGRLSETDRMLGQALADVAAVALTQRRTLDTHRQRSEQLAGALRSRVYIEQAKGMLAERLGVDPGTAFERMRQHSRRAGRRLDDVARGIVDDGCGLPGDAPTAPPR